MKRMPGVRVLLADDEVHLREILRDLFEFEGAIVTEASGGRQAIALLKERSFDVVLTDLRMPDGDGAEILRFIESSGRDGPPCFVLTGDSSASFSVLQQLGVAGIFSKPFDDEELIHSLAKALARPRSTGG